MNKNKNDMFEYEMLFHMIEIKISKKTPHMYSQGLEIFATIDAYLNRPVLS